MAPGVCLWLQGSVAPGVYGSMGLWFLGSGAPGVCGSRAMWLQGFVALELIPWASKVTNFVEQTSSTAFDIVILQIFNAPFGVLT